MTEKKRTNEDIQKRNEQLEKDAAALREAGIDAKVVDVEQGFSEEDLKSIEELQKELEKIEPKKSGRLDELINEQNMESGTNADSDSK